MSTVNSTTTTTTTTAAATDPVRAAGESFSAALAAKDSADAAFAAARAVTAAARARIASPAVDDDAATLITALHAGSAGEEIADLTREIAEGKIIAAQVALKAAIDTSLEPAFNQIVADRIAACVAADAAREALASAQLAFDTGTVKLYALRGAGRTGIPDNGTIEGNLTVPQYRAREIHDAGTEREIWGISA